MTQKTHIRIGIGGWTFEPWRGLFYPKGLTHAKELSYAAERLTSIKGSRYVTNRRVLSEAGKSIERFLGSGPTEMGDKLGPLLWQFAPFKKFDPSDFAAFLELLPEKFEGHSLRHVVEVRHDSFKSPEFIALLRKHNVAVVYTDHDTYPNIADTTADFVYLRLQRGDDDVPTAYPPKDINAWAKRLDGWSQGKPPADLPVVDAKTKPKAAPRDVFAYVIHEGKVRAPAAAMALIEKLKE